MVKNQNIVFKDMSKSIAPAIVPIHLISSSVTLNPISISFFLGTTNISFWKLRHTYFLPQLLVFLTQKVIH